MKKQLLFVGLPLLWATLLSAQTFEDDLQHIARQNQLMGMSVIVVQDNQVASEYHYGWADKGRQIGVTSETIYRIASISKAVTATALMKLYEEGHLALDDDVNDYLNFELRNPHHPAKAITFRMLLSHTSGLRDGDAYHDFLGASYNQNPPPGIKELLVPGGQAYGGNMWAEQAPGAYFNYSNINFGVIATLIEAISGQRFDVYVREQLLEPLGITGSFNVQDIDDINQVAVLYRRGVPQSDHYQGNRPAPRDLSDYTPGHNGLLFAPQGGLRVSARDLSRILLLHNQYGQVAGTRLLDSTTIALMHQPQWTYNGQNGNNYYNLFNSWGLGMHRITNQPGGDIVVPGISFVGHPGEAYGLISDMYLNPEKELGIIFLTNGYTGNQSYQFGKESAFYVPEESVYQAFARHFLSSSGRERLTADDDPFFTLDTAANQLLFSLTDYPANLRLINRWGQVVWQGRVTGPRLLLPELATGLYIVEMHQKNLRRAQRLLISK